jgi:hypothetical protein
MAKIAARNGRKVAAESAALGGMLPVPMSLRYKPGMRPNCSVHSAVMNAPAKSCSREIGQERKRALQQYEPARGGAGHAGGLETGSVHRSGGRGWY